MNIRILAVGDVVGDEGLEFLSRKLHGVKKLYDVHFTVVNGENTGNHGLLPRQAEEIFSAGADVITMGNHTWAKLQIADYMEETPATTSKSIRFPNDVIESVEEAIRGTNCNFSAFVIEAVRVALENLEETK